MAERKSGSTSQGNKVQVIVELVVPKGQAAAVTMQRAAGVGGSVFEVDTSYPPVPAGEPADATAKAMLEANRQETVFVR